MEIEICVPSCSADCWLGSVTGVLELFAEERSAGMEFGRMADEFGTDAPPAWAEDECWGLASGRMEGRLLLFTRDSACFNGPVAFFGSAPDIPLSEMGDAHPRRRIADAASTKIWLSSIIAI